MELLQSTSSWQLPLLPVYISCALLCDWVDTLKEMLVDLPHKLPASLRPQNQIQLTRTARHVPPTQSDLPPLPASPAEQPSSITPSSDISSTGARCSLRLSHTHSTLQTRLHSAQDSAHFRLWRSCTSGENHGAADEITTRWKRRGGGMSRCRGSC